MSDETTLRAELAETRRQIDAHRNSQPDRGSLAWGDWHAQSVALAKQRDRLYGELSRRRYAARVFSDTPRV